MARKKSGHFCRGCGQYRANEKFSGKGHKLHICKDCKREGVSIEGESFTVIKPRHNPYMKPLKVKQVVYTKVGYYVFIQYQGKRYATVIYIEENPSVIFRYEKGRDVPFVVAEELMKDFEEVWEVILIKYSRKIEDGDSFDYDFLDYVDQLQDFEGQSEGIMSEYLELLEIFNFFLMKEFDGDLPFLITK